MKIFCVGKNYEAHAKEMDSEVPSSPMIFMKPSTALLPYGRPFFYPDFSNSIHYELELVVKIKEQGKSIAKSDALKYVGEVSLGIDFTARDLQNECKKQGAPWEIAKSFDYSAAIGKWKTIDLSKLRELNFQLHKNGAVVQDGHTSQMIYDVPTIIHYISHRFTLQKGDLIYTGTPEGVGPVNRGDLLEGYFVGEKILFTEIK